MHFYELETTGGQESIEIYQTKDVPYLYGHIKKVPNNLYAANNIQPYEMSLPLS